MKKILSTLFIFLLLSTSAYSKSGKGNINLSKNAMERFLDYLFGGAKNLNPNSGGGTSNKGRKTKPLLFTLSEDGKSFSFNYCSFSSCTDPSRYKAIKSCENYSGGITCFTFAVKSKIVWKNNQNPKGLNLKKAIKEGRAHVAQIIKDAGYYEGDITLLRGFESETWSSKKEIPKKIVKKYQLKGERSIAMSWEGYSNLIAGTIEFNEVDYKGILNLALPNNDGTCDGTYSLQKDGKGTWKIACSNNLGAAGTLTWNKNGSVTGKGRDYKDNKVKFTVSK